MRLAYFSPLPPAKTGIATYSSELLPALADHYDITVFTPTPSARVPARVSAVNFVTDPGTLKSVPGFDRVVYHLGNNPYFHLDIFRAFLLWPDTVVLHDIVLYFLAAGGGMGGLLRELMHVYPTSTFEIIDAIEKESPGNDALRFSAPSKYPCLRRVLLTAPHIIVHNQAARQEIEALGYLGHVSVVPLLHYGAVTGPSHAEAMSLREKYGLPTDCILFGVFGFIGPTKRLDKVIAALSRMSSAGKLANVRLLIVGEGEPIVELVRESGLDEIVVATGYVDDREFRSLLSSVDVVLNLRYPSHGESSATLIQAMLHGRACIVTDDASFSELPDDSVIKVGHGTSEVDQIEDALTRVAQNRAMREAIGMQARKYVADHHSPAEVAAKYRDALARRPSARKNSVATPSYRTAMSTFVTQYLETRLRGLAP